MRRELKKNCVRCVGVVFLLSFPGAPFAAERLLPIPKWLPTEPGQKLEYQSQQGSSKLTILAEVREITHSADAYSLSARVNVRDTSGWEATTNVDLHYRANILTVTLPWCAVEFLDVPVVGKVGDAIEVRLLSTKTESGKDKEGKTIATATCVSVGTKVAINGQNWDDATGLVFTGAMDIAELKDSRVKMTLAGPEGLIRLVFQKGGGDQTIELVPPRRPFDK